MHINICKCHLMSDKSLKDFEIQEDVVLCRKVCSKLTTVRELPHLLLSHNYLFKSKCYQHHQFLLYLRDFEIQGIAGKFALTKNLVLTIINWKLCLQLSNIFLHSFTILIQINTSFNAYQYLQMSLNGTQKNITGRF